MYQDSDIVSVFNFLKDTPEGPLRKMMVGGEMSEAHFRVLLKIAKTVKESEFVEHFNAEGMPKLRLTPAEMPLKETLWPVSKRKLVELGLLGAAQKAAA